MISAADPAESARLCQKEQILFCPRKEITKNMFYLLLAVLCSSLVALVLKCSAKKTESTYGIYIFNYIACFMTGFLFLGASYGILMKTSGFSFLYPLAMSLTIFGGSLEFVAVSMLLGSFAPLQTLIMTLLIQARHLFYGVAMLDKYKGTGWKKLYLIFGMCDESFSINCSTEIPEEVDKGWFMFFCHAAQPDLLGGRGHGGRAFGLACAV
jgi:hypothetical protein